MFKKFWFVLVLGILALSMAACSGTATPQTIVVTATAAPTATPDVALTQVALLSTQVANMKAEAEKPVPTLPEAQNLPQGAPQPQPASASSSLNYDESNNDPLPIGQDVLIGPMFRYADNAGNPRNATWEDFLRDIPIVQAIAQLVGAEVHEGSGLVLDSYKAWFVWAPNGKGCNTPSDVSDVLDGRYANDNAGRIWIQGIFDPQVPARSDNVWQCEIWAVAVH